MSDTQHFNAVLTYLVSRLGPFVQIAILAVAIVAARRHRLGGLWLLAAAAAALALRDIANAALSPSFIASNEKVMVYWIALQYVPFFAAVIALFGWCALAFSRKRCQNPGAEGASPNGSPVLPPANSGASEGPPSVS
jgi:hypothetical protein